MRRIIKLLNQFLNKAPKTVIEILSLILLFLIAGIDFYFSPKVTLSLFYLIPVVITTWFINKTNGIIISVICTLILIFMISRFFF